MKTIGRVWMVGTVAAAALLCSLGAQAATVSDRAAAVLVWPKILVDSSDNIDTLLQITNLNVGECNGGIRDGEECVRNADCGGGTCQRPTSVVAAHCFYVNANSHCSNSGEICDDGADCPPGGICVDGWLEINFDIFLTPDQPLGWVASEGLGGSATPLPCRRLQVAPFNTCATSLNPRLTTNAGTRVPPVPEDPFIGELKCIQVDPNTRAPAPCDFEDCRNDLAGHATVEGLEGPDIDPAKYNAVGLVAVRNDGDRFLGIGNDPDEGVEYDACADVLVLNHLFDGAVDPISGDLVSETELTLVPCSQDFATQDVEPVTAQFLVFNEFEQRFSASRQVDCLLDSQLSLIDTTQPNRSIFSAGVSGTVAGQTRIRGVNGGLIGVAIVNFENGTEGSAAYNLNQQADRSEGDRIRIP